MSSHVENLIDAAAKAHAEGRLGEAENLARQALDVHPNDQQATLILGILAVKRNDAGTAIPLLVRALEFDPASFDAAFWLSLVFRKLGRKTEALSMAQRAVSSNEKSEHAQNQLGMCFLDLERPEEAAFSFLSATRLAPKVAPFYDNLGRALQAMGRTEDSISAYRQALEIGPVTMAALFRLGDALMALPDAEGAGRCAREMLRLQPNSASGNLLLARALIGAGAVAEGAKYAQKAIELSPANAAPVAYYGRALQSLGKIEEADEQFKRSIELEPRQGFAYYALVHNHRVDEAERTVVDKMRELAHDRGLPRKELIQLEYGLGKALEDLGDYEEAIGHFDEANRLDHLAKVGVAPFEKKTLERTANFLIRTFDRVFLDRFRSMGLESDVPIFVVGMMRSGTTLAEQILSSHPDVGGVGEQLFWPENAGSSDKLFRLIPPGLPQADPSAFDIGRLRGLAAEYLAILEKLAPNKSRVVDKMNTNYLLLGVLHIAYPHAKIVHMKRNPVDTCLSIWATPVANGIDLCGDRENVVFAYEQYVRVMAHWRRVLPPAVFLDVQYEELVSDQERVTRQMVEFCGLPWDDACLKPEQNVRSVKTPSVWQVRQPVYKSSTARWRKYEPWLGAFAKLQELEV